MPNEWAAYRPEAPEPKRPDTITQFTEQALFIRFGGYKRRKNTHLGRALGLFAGKRHHNAD